MQIPVIVKIRFWYSSSGSEKEDNLFFKLKKERKKEKELRVLQ